MLNILKLNKPKISDFALERNLLLKKSKSDWNIFLDSDEKMEGNINNLPPGYESFYITRHNFFLNTFVGTDKIIRVIKKGTGHWERLVHETWIPDNKDKVGSLSVKIIHNTADSLSSYIKKINYYSDLHAKANMKENKKSTIFIIIFFPIAKFFVTLIKSRHLVFSLMQSLHSFLSWSKLYFLQH